MAEVACANRFSVLAESNDDDELSVEELPSTLPLQEKRKKTLATKNVYIGHVDSAKSWFRLVEDAMDIGIVRGKSSLIWNEVTGTMFGFITMKYVEDAEAFMAKIGDEPWDIDIDCDYNGVFVTKRRTPYAQWERPSEKNKRKQKATQAEKKKKKKAVRRQEPTQ